MIGFNNPFNLRYAKNNHWIGLTGQNRGFCNFSSIDYGIRAAAILVMRSYRQRNVLTISQIIHRYAPESENETVRYIHFVCARLSCFPFHIPTRSDFPHLLCAMSVFEGNPVSHDEINRVIIEFNIKPFKCKLYEKESC